MLDRNGITGTFTEYDAVGRTTNVVRTTNGVVRIDNKDLYGQPMAVLVSLGVGVTNFSAVIALAKLAS